MMCSSPGMIAGRTSRSEAWRPALYHNIFSRHSRERSMPLPRARAEELAAERRAEAELAHRDTLWDYVLTALTCLVWAGLGIFLLMWSAHTTSLTYGRIAFWAGLAVGNGGVLFTLIAAYARGERRGDW
jgi:hypothetical protein